MQYDNFKSKLGKEYELFMKNRYEYTNILTDKEEIIINEPVFFLEEIKKEFYEKECIFLAYSDLKKLIKFMEYHYEDSIKDIKTEIDNLNYEDCPQKYLENNKKEIKNEN